MFVHIFKSRLRLLLRDRPSLFWTLFYPLILATLFSVAFSNLANATSFNSIPVAVVDNAEVRSQPMFLETLESASGDAGQTKYFSVTLTTQEEAKQKLRDNTLKGYILFENGAHVVVKDSGLEQTFIANFVDGYLQYGSAYMTIRGLNPAAAGVAGPADRAYVESVAPGKPNSANFVISIYGLLAMAAMFGSFWGRKEVEDIQADMSPQAMRMNLVPVHKLKAFVSSISAAILVHFLVLVVLVAYMAFALGIDFGTRLGYILIACFFASLMGVTFGAFVAALVRGSAGIRIAVMLAVSLILSALAGMVYPSLKYAVTQAVPAMSYINPANLITDAFYSLYYYSSDTRFFINIALMLGFSIVFSIAVYLVTRRQKYVSL
jgi:ABC-2 type transport system permease protein